MKKIILLVFFGLIFFGNPPKSFAGTCDPNACECGQATVLGTSCKSGCEDSMISDGGGINPPTYSCWKSKCDPSLCQCSGATVISNSPCGVPGCYSANNGDGTWSCWQQIPGINDPKCQAGSTEIASTVKGCSDDIKKKYCCQKGSFSFWACDGKPGTSFWDQLTCDNIIMTDKNNCTSYGQNWKLDPSTQKCVMFADSEWDASAFMTTCNGVQGIDTAIGCVPTGDLKAFVAFLLKYAMFASGGIIALMVISTGYTILTSQGNPEKMQGAKENIIALLSGFAMIAFSLILLKTIGADILKLPTF